MSQCLSAKAALIWPLHTNCAMGSYTIALSAQQPAAVRDRARCTGNISTFVHPPLALCQVGSACCCAFGAVCTTMETSPTTPSVWYVACKDHTADTSVLTTAAAAVPRRCMLCVLCVKLRTRQQHAQLQALYSQRFLGASKLRISVASARYAVQLHPPPNSYNACSPFGLCAEQRRLPPTVQARCRRLKSTINILMSRIIAPSALPNCYRL
jgi:hypothetical protein